MIILFLFEKHVWTKVKALYTGNNSNRYRLVLFSDYLKEKLDKYVSNIHKVKLIRSKVREGLIRARLLGELSLVGDAIIKSLKVNSHHKSYQEDI